MDIHMKKSKIKFYLYATPDNITDKQIKILNRLDKKLFPADSLYPKKGRWWWVAMSNGRIVGFAGLSVLTKYTKDWGYLCRVGVLRKYRKRGIHSKFITLRIAKGKKLGLKKLITAVAIGNEESANQIIKKGFKLYVPEQKWLAIPAYYFYKDLTAKKKIVR